MKTTNQTKRTAFIALACTSLVGLSACGSSDEDAGIVTGPSGTVYVPVTSRVETASDLSGVGVEVRGGAAPSQNVVNVSGSRDPDGTVTVASSGLSPTVTDADGIDFSGTLTDGTNTITTETPGASYQYVRQYRQESVAAGSTDEVIAVGVFGQATNDADITTAATVTYNGSGEAIYATTGNNAAIFDGTSTVTADFGSGEVDVELDNFVRSTTGTTPPDAQITRIEINDMTISGNSFEGGTLQTFDGGTDNTTALLGAGPTTTSRGQFFGLDSGNGSPDEVGGVFLSNGTTARLTGTYIAD